MPHHVLLMIALPNGLAMPLCSYYVLECDVDSEPLMTWSEGDLMLPADTFDTVLQRLCEKVEITRNLVAIERIDLSELKVWERMATAVTDRNETDDQLQLALTHL